MAKRIGKKLAETAANFWESQIIDGRKMEYSNQAPETDIGEWALVSRFPNVTVEIGDESRNSFKQNIIHILKNKAGKIDLSINYDSRFLDKNTYLYKAADAAGLQCGFLMGTRLLLDSNEKTAIAQESCCYGPRKPKQIYPVNPSQ